MILGSDAFSPELFATARSNLGMRVSCIDEMELNAGIARRHVCGADIIAVHATSFGIGDGFLNMMQPHAWLIGAGKAMACLDQPALLHGLWFETIGGLVLSDGPELDKRFKSCGNAILLGESFSAADVPWTWRPTRTANTRH